MTTLRKFYQSREEFQDLHGIIYKSLFYHLKGKNIYALGSTDICGLERMKIDGQLIIGLRFRGFLGRKFKTTFLIKGNFQVLNDVNISSGCRFDVGKNATIKLDGCVINSESDFIINNGLEVGKDSRIGWNCKFTDEDFHSIHYMDKKECSSKEIIIGEHIWICNNVRIMKGVHIGDGSVVAAHSVVMHSFPDKNVLIGGYPAKIIKRDVWWD